MASSIRTAALDGDNQMSIPRSYVPCSVIDESVGVFGDDLCVTGGFVFVELLAPATQCLPVQVVDRLGKFIVALNSLLEFGVEFFDGLLAIILVRAIGIPKPATFPGFCVTESFSVSTPASVDVNLVVSDGVGNPRPVIIIASRGERL